MRPHHCAEHRYCLTSLTRPCTVMSDRVDSRPIPYLCCVLHTASCTPTTPLLSPRVGLRNLWSLEAVALLAQRTASPFGRCLEHYACHRLPFRRHGAPTRDDTTHFSLGLEPSQSAAATHALLHCTCRELRRRSSRLEARGTQRRCHGSMCPSHTSSFCTCYNYISKSSTLFSPPHTPRPELVHQAT